MFTLQELIDSNINLRTRSQLEPKFKTGEIPEEEHFQGLVHSYLSVKDDGVFKDLNNPLCILAGLPNSEGRNPILAFYDISDAPPKLTIDLETSGSQVNLYINGGVTVKEEIRGKGQLIAFYGKDPSNFDNVFSFSEGKTKILYQTIIVAENNPYQIKAAILAYHSSEGNIVVEGSFKLIIRIFSDPTFGVDETKEVSSNIITVVSSIAILVNPGLFYLEFSPIEINDFLESHNSISFTLEWIPESGSEDAEVSFIPYCTSIYSN